MKNKLTQKQKVFLEYIISYTDEYQISPSITDLMEQTGLKSKATVHGYLERLRRKGYITWFDKTRRTIQVLDRNLNGGKSEMLELNCKELYRLPITIDLVEDFYKLGMEAGRRQTVVENIYSNKNVSSELKIEWMVQYNKEWFEKITNILTSLRAKANLQDEEHLFTYDLSSKELIVLDMLKTDYDKLCKDHCYLVRVNYNEAG